jgi:hypothetical protein
MACRCADRDRCLRPDYIHAEQDTESHEQNTHFDFPRLSLQGQKAVETTTAEAPNFRSI